MTTVASRRVGCDIGREARSLAKPGAGQARNESRPPAEDFIFFWGTILAIFYTFFSVLIFPGYRTESEDQSLYTPAVLQHKNPKLFTRDFLMSNTQTKATLYDEFVASFLVNESSIYPVYFFLSLFSRFLFFLGIILISKGISRSTLFSLFAPILFIIGHAGFICNALAPSSWLFSFDLELHARSLAISLLCFSLGLFLIKKDFLAWLLGSSAILVHLVSAIPFFAFLGVYTLKRELLSPKENRKYFKYFLLPAAAFGILTINTILSKSPGREGIQFLAFIDPAWETFMEERTSYLFPLKWLFSEANFPTVIVPLFIFFFISQRNNFLKKESKKIFQYWVGIVLSLIAIGISGFDFFKIALFAQLQFLRSLLWLQILLPISAFFVLFEACKKNYKKHFFKTLIFSFAVLGIILQNPSFSPFFLASLYLLNGFYRKYFRLPLLLGTIVAFLLQLIFLALYLVSPELGPKALLKNFLIHSLKISVSFLLLFLYLFIAKKGEILNMPKVRTAGIKLTFVCLLLASAYISQNYEHIVINNRCSPSYCQMLKWTRKNTNNQSLFFVEEDLRIERTLRSRFYKNIFVAVLDGAQGTFSRIYALEWLARSKLAENPKENLEILENKYAVDYAIMSKKTVLPRQIVFENKGFRIYKLK